MVEVALLLYLRTYTEYATALLHYRQVLENIELTKQEFNRHVSDVLLDVLIIKISDFSSAAQ